MAKHREARREETAESKGKQNKSNIVYNAVDKMQNETKYGEAEKLQMAKHEIQSEIDDERARIIEILREHFPSAFSSSRGARNE